MSRIVFYGGTTLAVALFISAILFFFLFKVPSIHKYFRRNSRKGLVTPETASASTQVEAPKGPKRVTRAEYENRTEIIGNWNDRKNTRPMVAEASAENSAAADAAGSPINNGEDYTRILSKTELL